MRATNKSLNLSNTNKRKVKVFLFILLLTFIIWLLIQLSKVKSSTVIFSVEYKNSNKELLLENKPISEVGMLIKAPGFSLLKYKLSKKKVSLNLSNLVKSKTGYYLLPDKQKPLLNSQFSSEVEVLNVLVDSIYIELGKNVTKKVPIHPTLDINYKLGYNLIDDYQVIPDSITIIGPQKYIDSITEVSNKALKLTDVYSDIDKNLNLKLTPKYYNVVFSKTKFRIKAKVDKFTEGKFKIPAVIINKPDNLNVTLIPNEIEVVYQSGLSNFNKIAKNSFLIVFDFNQYKNDTLVRQLTPIVKKKSEFVSSLKVIPEHLDFLIEK